MSLYTDLRAAGIPTDNHESDLYFPLTEESKRILDAQPFEHSYSYFTNQVEGGVWVDVPFAFDPWWETRRRRHSV